MVLVPRKKWNISILVLFVLIASSLMWVLTLHFTQELMKYQSDIYSYYTSYYMAKAWLELWLTQAATRWIGFDYQVTTWTSLLRNFACSWQCLFSVDVLWRSQLLGDGFWKWTGCSQETAFTLRPWWSLLIPLFTEDTSFASVYDTLSSVWIKESLTNYRQDLVVQYPEWSQLSSFTYWLLILSWGDLYENGTFFRVASSLDDFFTQFDEYVQTLAWDSQFTDMINIFGNEKFDFYILISNTENSVPTSLCLWHPSNQVGKIVRFPTQKFYIKSSGIYRDKQVWIQALYKQALPDFLVNTYSSQ